MSEEVTSQFGRRPTPEEAEEVRGGEERKKLEECVFHQVHLELHSARDLLREIQNVS